MSPGRTDRVAGVFLVLVAIGVAAESWGYRVGFVTDPVGPRGLPFLVAFLFAAAGLALALRPGEPRAWPDASTLLRLALATAVFLAYAVLLEPIGFVAATSGVVAALSLLFGAPARAAVPAAVVLAGALYAIFVYGLALRLPVGRVFGGGS